MSAPRVSEALLQVYSAFAAEPKPRQILACPCCVDRVGVCTLLSTALRQLTPEQLSDYASKVFLTAGSRADFRYFLPRILEISLSNRSWWPDREVVLGKLALANWATWPRSETDLLHQLFEVSFDEALLSEQAAWEVDSWICGLSLAGVDVAAYLRKLEAPGTETVMREFFELNAASLRKGKLTNAFWADHRAKAAPVIAWFESSDVQAAVWRHYGAG